MSPDLISDFSFQLGYAPENSGELRETEFDIQEAELDALYQTLAEKGVLRSKWFTGQPLLGGKGTSLVITAGSKEYEIPNVSILAPQEREKVEK